ncbi:gamma-glutamyltransferase 5a [Hypomesus transpacificus]|uniref:gamma-glutamyltransferase 5a n=1 Tax=Hypomesus transpacificus TaxID=137520 RepID=UPI001F073E7C|nr:gamma-glutamyltransferase 5a [Hypomesus transpacificus]
MARSKARLYTCLSLTVLCVIIIIVCIAVSVNRGCPEEVYKHAAVAADSETCSKVGRNILQKGGSAVDGAIATLLCTSVIHPQSMGIGGGSIFTVMDSNGVVKIINARERVPKKLTTDLLSKCPQTGSLWIGVPGEIRGYEQAHRLYGKLPWASLFQPTIQLAREGFPLPPILGRFVHLADKNETPALRQLFSDKDGNMLKVNDTLKFEKLADTLEVIANQGADAFYTGKIAENLVRDIRESGGSLTMEDLQSFKVTVTDAWTVPLGEYKMHLPPPPAGGAILSLLLNIMKGYNLDAAAVMGEQKILTYHRYIEACKFANGLRKYIRDPQFNPEGKAFNFTKQNFADHIRSKISSDRSYDDPYYDVTPYVESMGTTHVSVLAEDGSAVSVTSTINHIFGSNVVSPSTGVILNNELSDFCGKAEHVVAGEQPPSSMSPVVLHSKSKTLVIGGSGGSMITTGMASTLMYHLWFGKSLHEAISTPIVFVDSKNAVKFEPDFDKSVSEALKALGHTVKSQNYFFNVVNAVKKEDGCIHAVSDSRKLGKPAGY